MFILRIALLLLLGYLEVSCLRVPTEKLNQFTISVDRRMIGDSLAFTMINPVHAPLQVRLQSSDTLIGAAIQNEPLMIVKHLDTLDKKWLISGFSTLTDTAGFANKLNLSINLSATEFNEDRPKIELPFPAGKRYRIMQGYNSSFSHNGVYSRYAIDFAMPIGDTVCAAADGYVVGVIEDYTEGANDRRLRDFANFITLYHPEGEFLTQYVHLSHDGALVEVGDTVRSGQVIGLSGDVGFVSGAHLHFNVLQPQPGKSPVSAPIDFREGYEGRNLRKNDWVRKPADN